MIYSIYLLFDRTGVRTKKCAIWFSISTRSNWPGFSKIDWTTNIFHSLSELLQMIHTLTGLVRLSKMLANHLHLVGKQSNHWSWSANEVISMGSIWTIFHPNLMVASFLVDIIFTSCFALKVFEMRNWFMYIVHKHEHDPCMVILLHVRWMAGFFSSVQKWNLEMNEP